MLSKQMKYRCWSQRNKMQNERIERESGIERKNVWEKAGEGRWGVRRWKRERMGLYFFHSVLEGKDFDVQQLGSTVGETPRSSFPSSHDWTLSVSPGNTAAARGRHYRGRQNYISTLPSTDKQGQVLQAEKGGAKQSGDTPNRFRGGILKQLSSRRPACEKQTLKGRKRERVRERRRKLQHAAPPQHHPEAD